MTSAQCTTDRCRSPMQTSWYRNSAPPAGQPLPVENSLRPRSSPLIHCARSPSTRLRPESRQTAQRLPPREENISCTVRMSCRPVVTGLLSSRTPRTPAPSHLEALITTEPNSSIERRELYRPLRCARNPEEGLVRFGMQVQIVLQRATMRAVIGKAAFPEIRPLQLSERRPTRKLC